MSLVRLILRSSRWIALVAAVAGLVAGAGGVGMIALIQRALAGDDHGPGWFAERFAGLCLTVLFARVASQALLILLAQRSAYRLYVHLSRAIVALPQRQLESIGTHRLLATLTEDVPAIAGALLGLPIVGVNAAILLCCFAYMGWLSPSLLVGVLGFLAVGVLSYQLPVWSALRQLHQARCDHDELMKCFRGLTEGIKELKLHRARREAFLDQHLETTAARVRDRNTAGMTIYAAAGAWGQLLFFICMGLLLFVPGALGNTPRTVVSGYIMAILYCIAPLETITTWLPIFGKARVALQAVDDLALSSAGCEPEFRPAEPPLAFEQLELDGVTHAYPGEEDDGFVLGPLDMSLGRGEVVFIVGGNGSGKTTLAKLLVGLYAPASGEVRLNGRPVIDSDRERYRQLFSVVFSDSYVFDYILGMENAHLEAQAHVYLHRLELAHKVRVEGGKLSTTELSQGQRKRLALLTAYLEDRPIYVFDEWAADQDPRFKALFYTRLLPELKARGKALLVITHDDHYFHLADTIIKLDYGMVQETRPTHEPKFCESF
jgi:putative ATP-binding cassette transporter